MRQAPWLFTESKELFRTIFFDNSIVGIALLSVNDIILEVNQVWCDILGYTRNELIGRHLSDFIHQDDIGLDAGRSEALLQGVIRDYIVEKRYLRKDGATLWGRLNISAIRDKHGRLRLKLALLDDITPLKARESEITAQRCIYGTMLDVLTKALIPSSQDKITRHLPDRPFNLQKVKWVEMVAEEVIKVACCFTMASGGVYFGYDECRQSLNLISATGITETVKTALAAKSFALGEEEGVVGLVAVTKKPLYLADAAAEPGWSVVGETDIRSAYFLPLYYREKLFGVVAFFSDRINGFGLEQRTLIDSLAYYISAALENAHLFTNVYETCKILSTTQEQLLHVKKMEAIGRLAGGIAHALNNQLTIIQASVDLQIPHISRCSPLYRSLLKIRKAAWNSANLARQLMLFGQKQPQFRVVLDLNRSLQELGEMLERLCGEEITIRFELASDLRLIMADAANIDQVIINLVLNARDAMPEGGTITIKTENVRITVPSSSGQNTLKDFVCFTVSDTGTGIEDELISCIFDPFFTTKEPGEGTGLGLSVAYGIVKAHGGWINVKTKVGSGTTFEVLLPAVDPEKLLERR